MDLDAYVAAHRPEWERLERLVRRAGRPRRMSGAELDELVELYQRTATHLSVVRTRSPAPSLVDALSGLVTRARAAVAGAREPSWREAARFLTVTFPAAVYLRRWWVLGTAAVFLGLAAAVGAWVVGSPEVQNAVLPPGDVRQLCEQEFAQYYRSNPAGSFATQVWTNNVWVSAAAIAFGALLGLPTVYVLALNSLNLGVAGGFMTSCGRAGQFYTLILPHGMLELTAVFVAGAVGLRLGWAVVDPGPRRRLEALAVEGRGAVGVALGLVVVLAVSGLLEAFVTPSPLPAWARLAVGGLLWAGFVAAVGVLGRRPVRAGSVGDLAPADAGDLAPSV
ncbi:MAG TPA: stage II sporulation protein M [Frankiaceae bacterium]|nr:stage II sporulation protein M [Frankiaceae bacterium]